MLIDTHCHLFLTDFQSDIEEVLQNAKNKGIKYIIIPAIDLNSSKQILELVENNDQLFGAVGIHPLDSKDYTPDMLIQLEEFASNPKIVAIGEIGLDFYYDYSPKDIQLKAFRDQLDLAVNTNLPVIIHTRDSIKETIEIIKEYSHTNLKAVFHCFSGSVEDASALIELGHYISFTGNITFKNAEEVRQVAAMADEHKIMLETDSPYMSPVPFRGKRNEPANVLLAAEKLAEIRNVTLEEIERITTVNAIMFFDLPANISTSYTYKLGNSLYINVTNRCNANCTFCDRTGEAVLHGYNLKMPKSNEPSSDVYIKEIGDPRQYDEIVFCGYGEPTIRWNVVKKIAAYVKQNGGSTRINTNGHGNVINKRDITPEFEGLIDVISVSLNSVYPEQYKELMQVNESFYYEMIDFCKKSKPYVKSVVMTVVNMSEIDVKKAKAFVEDEIGVQFRERNYF